MSKVERAQRPDQSAPLRRGWTTGACAAAATKSALNALLDGEFIDPVEIVLPKGDKPSFVLANARLQNGTASASIIKDAGDDPDVTHGALITSTVSKAAKGTGIRFKAGVGVGTVTKPGLPIAVGEPAINPVPRQLMSDCVKELCRKHHLDPDIEVEISVPGGEKLAQATWNPRLGIVGGISILGTTGVVHPFSCSAWIHSIHRGIDVCRAMGIAHVLGATGSTSEQAADRIYHFPPEAMLDMGDFAGGLLKYLRKNPIERLTLAGGFAKFSKLATGSLDLHSARSQVDMDWLADQAVALGLPEADRHRIQNANTAQQALEMTQNMDLDLPDRIATLAAHTAKSVLEDAAVAVETLIVSRAGSVLARTEWQ